MLYFLVLVLAFGVLGGVMVMEIARVYDTLKLDNHICYLKFHVYIVVHGIHK